MVVKICFLASFFDFPKQKALTYYEKIFPKSVKLYLLCPKPVKDKFNVSRAEVHTYTGKIKIFSKIRKFCRKEKIDLLTNLGGTYKMASALAFATFLTDTKSMFYFRGNFYSKEDPDPEHMFFLTFLGLQFFISRFLIAGKDICEKAKKWLYFSKDKMFYLPTVIDTDFFTPGDKIKARNNLKLPSSKKIIIYVGRIQKKKGSDFLLKIIKKNPDKKFILIGKLMDKNYEKENLKNLLVLYNKTEEQVREYYRASDLCLFLSKNEGCARVPREAMSCQVPTIVSDIDFLKTLEPAIKTKLNVKKIQKNIDDFFNLQDKEKISIGKKSREHIVNEFSEKRLTNKHFKYFLRF